MEKQHLAPLDVLRGVAVLLVIGRHFPFVFPEKNPYWLMPLAIWRRVGWTGVDLFFILSGFLVSGLLFREYQRRGKIDLLRFFIRRGIRVYVPFYAYLLLASPLRLNIYTPDRVALEVFFLQSYIPAWTIWNHTWTLAVEEHFYLFLGIVAFILSKQKKAEDPFRLFIPIWVFLALGCLLMRIGTPYNAPIVMTASHMRFDSLFFGVLLSYLYHFHRGGYEGFVRKFWWAIAALSISVIYPVLLLEPGHEPWMTRFGFTCLYLASGGFLSLSLFGKKDVKAGSQWALSPMVGAVGRMSYSVYLWHIPACIVLTEILHPKISDLSAWLNTIFYVLMCLGAGWLSHQFIEKPSLAWRDKKFPTLE